MLRQGFANVRQVETKRDFHDVVTQYDRDAEEAIGACLLRRVPNSAICGEEHGVRGSGEVTWYVDPIDGTANFAIGVPFFCVSIAAVQDDEVLAAVIYDPLRSEVFSACLDETTCNGQPIVSRGASADGEALLVTGFPKYRPWELAPASRSEQEIFAEMVASFRTVRRLGSAALSLAYVAAGRVDVAFDIFLNPWDVAAGALLVAGAGGAFHPIPATAEYLAAPWKASATVAHVGNFDLTTSCLASLVMSCA